MRVSFKHGRTANWPRALIIQFIQPNLLLICRRYWFCCNSSPVIINMNNPFFKKGQHDIHSGCKSCCICFILSIWWSVLAQNLLVRPSSCLFTAGGWWQPSRLWAQIPVLSCYLPLSLIYKNGPGLLCYQVLIIISKYQSDWFMWRQQFVLLITLSDQW